MTKLRASASRPWIAVVLAVVLSLAGAGRGWASTARGFDLAPLIAGVAAPICHAGSKNGPVPEAPGPYDRCDACALCTPAIPLRTSDAEVPTRVAHAVAPAVARLWPRIVVRLNTPRLS